MASTIAAVTGLKNAGKLRYLGMAVGCWLIKSGSILPAEGRLHPHSKAHSRVVVLELEKGNWAPYFSTDPELPVKVLLEKIFDR
jgi:hypothetical protein